MYVLVMRNLSQDYQSLERVLTKSLLLMPQMISMLIPQEYKNKEDILIQHIVSRYQEGNQLVHAIHCL